MKYKKYVIVVILFLITGLSTATFSISATSDDQVVNSTLQSIKAQNKKSTTAIDMPIYKPHKRGVAPNAIVGMNSRGVESELSTISVLAPDHIGLTVHEQPSIYWYLSKPISSRIEFTLSDNQAVRPLLKTNLKTLVQPGIQRLNLADYNVRLSPGKQYQWIVSLLPDPDHSSQEIIVGGAIECIEFTQELAEKLAQESKAEAPHIYAEAGLWYDALSALSDLIETTPDDMVIRKQHASLLEQAGLLEIARHGENLAITLDDQRRKPKQQSTTAQKGEPASAVIMPTYKPPKRGAPRALVGGGSRGTGSGLSPLSVLAPDHTGLTIQEQPSLYWYLAEQNNNQIEFTLIDNQAIKPILEINLGTQIKPGIHCLNLADYGAHLLPDRQYRWFVAMVTDPDHRSKDIMAGAAIERIVSPEALSAKLVRAGKTKAPHIYAEAGLWYDTLSAISDLVAIEPNDTVLRKQRTSLIEQVGLPEVAEYEMKFKITIEN
jgi:hypothetical protein